MIGKPKITQVTGWADSFELSLTKAQNGLWEISVPPDTQDGVYAVSLKAVNELGETSYWTGFLYMCNGVCHLEMKPEKYSIVFSQKEYKLLMSEPKYKVFFEEGCRHDRAD